MSRVQELFKNTGILMIARISTQLVSFLLLPLYTALLTTAEYGEIDIYTSLVMILVPFLTLQLEMGLFRFFITDKSLDSRKKIVSTSFCTIAIILVVASLIYVILISLFHIKYVLLVFLYYISMTISTVLLQVCRAYGDNKAYGFASFLSSALSVCLNVLLIAGLHWKVEGILLSSIIAQFISSIFIIYRTKVFRYFRLKYFDKGTQKKLLNYSVPLVFNQISSWAINYSDRIIILTAWGTGANGIYSLANKFSNLMNTFFNIFNVAWTENVVRSMSDNDGVKYINKIFGLIYNIYFVLITGVINLLPLLFRLLVNENYNDAYGHIPILLLAMFFSGMAATIGSIYIAYGKTKEVSITTIMAGCCNVLIHFILLKTCGLYAASISTLVAFGSLFIYRYIFVKKFFALEISFKKIIPQLAVYIYVLGVYISRNTIMVITGLLFNLAFVVILLWKNKLFILNITGHEK